MSSTYCVRTINVSYMRLFRLLMGICLFSCVSLSAQDHEWEYEDIVSPDKGEWSRVKEISLGWGNIDTRYARHIVPTLSQSLQLEGWKGERLAAQAVLLTPKALSKVSFEVSDLKGSKGSIPSSAVKKYFVGYTMADAYADKKGKYTHDHTKSSLFDSSLVADRLSPLPFMAVKAGSVRPLWLDIRIPSDVAAGLYKGYLVVTADGKKLTLPLSVKVADRTLPPPSQWSFHLDLWQNPFAVARYYDVPLWSKEHFDLMRPLMKLLADAGQKVITASVIQHPWNSQTEDPFESMIGKMLRLDGTWQYDYTVFDRWVEFMIEMGIDQQIDCYTILPWHLRFEYFDQAVNATRVRHLQPGTAPYHDYLLPFLKDFAAHLKSKGWFERTCIATDERPMEMLRAAWDVVKEADPAYRIEGAANYYPEVEPVMYDLSVTYQHGILPPDVLAKRKEQGKKLTFYTCCSPERPNTFTFSPPAESELLGLHAVAAGYDGYLRWAYNSWVKAPNQDSRFRTWASGDCFLVYPGGSSIRMERLVHGIQDFEKVKILRRQLKGKSLQRLENALQPFVSNNLKPSQNAADMVNTFRHTVNLLSR